MADAFSSLVAEFSNRLAHAEGQGSETWSARHPSGRKAIRESLKNAFSDWTAADIQSLADLDEAPRPYARSASISHTHDFGGWMTVSRPAQIGWDIELKKRIKDEIIKRVCTAEELADAPQLPLLWGAKESFFKALEDEQPDVIQQLTIDDWKALGPGLWSFRGLGARNGEGLVLDSEPWILAACLIR